MPRITSLLLLGGLLAAPLATGVAQDRVRPAARGETPRREAAPDRSRAEPRREEPRREEPRREEPRPRVQERAEPRREAPAERREPPPPRSTGEPELRRRKADNPD